DILRAHVHLAREAQERRGGRGRDAVLARAGLGNHPPLAHPLGEERLAEDVVDLVGAGVTEVLALQVDPGAAGLLAEARREVERGGPPGVVAEEPGEARLERGVAARPGVRALELDERG